MTISDLPDEAVFDECHKEWREGIINAAKLEGLTFSHGIAAKLINTYLKARFMLNERGILNKMKHFHLPKDSLLLKGTEEKNVDQKKRYFEVLWQKRMVKF